jgi:hypothetical protein
LSHQETAVVPQFAVLVTKIEEITKYNSKPYYRQALLKLAEINPDNANVICDYIIAEQTEINIKESVFHITDFIPDFLPAIFPRLPICCCFLSVPPLSCGLALC